MRRGRERTARRTTQHTFGEEGETERERETRGRVGEKKGGGALRHDDRASTRGARARAREEDREIENDGERSKERECVEREIEREIEREREKE